MDSRGEGAGVSRRPSCGSSRWEAWGWLRKSGAILLCASWSLPVLQHAGWTDPDLSRSVFETDPPSRGGIVVDWSTRYIWLHQLMSGATEPEDLASLSDVTRAYARRIGKKCISPGLVLVCLTALITVVYFSFRSGRRATRTASVLIYAAIVTWMWLVLLNGADRIEPMRYRTASRHGHFVQVWNKPERKATPSAWAFGANAAGVLMVLAATVNSGTNPDESSGS